MAETLFDGAVFADYFQIYLRDAAHVDLPDDYSDASIARRLMVGPHAAVIHTLRNMAVLVRVEWHAERPEPALALYQHVVEAGIGCPSGQLLLAGLSDGELEPPRFAVPAGAIGVRACLSGLETLSADGLDGDDHYLMQLWPQTTPGELALLKLWPTA